MPRVPLHALIWSAEQHLYELYSRGQLTHRFRPAEEAAWLTWLREAPSFAFHGASGSLNVYQEARPRGGPYWYAYHTTARRTHKRYLGSSAQVTFARLEVTAQALARASTLPSPSASPLRSLAVQPVLLSSKLAPPRLPNTLVERECLLGELDGALVTPLTLLAAPAGWGKTTLLATWASRHRAQVAWLSLEELDSSPTRFWVTLIAALRRCGHFGPSLGETAVTLLESPQPPGLSACLSNLLQELERYKALAAPLVLVLDDYHLVSNPAIHESLSFFLEHLPAQVHLILSSRVDPDLPLSRLRTRGQLTELRADKLRFDQEEASHYLGHMLSSPLSEEEVRQLVSRTEGWIAGLHLAALALRQHADRTAFLQAFSGSQRYLFDYVQEEILARLPESVRDFLLSASILSRLDASVCQAVTASASRAESQQMLLFLERANLFLVPLDEERRSYRLHELFREALLSALYASHPELVPLLHRRAADFYEAQEQWAEAITHAFDARDFSTATRLMEHTVEQFWVRGEAQTVQTWLVALPDAVLWPQARLALQATLRLLDSLFAATETTYARAQHLVEPMLARLDALLRLHAAGADQRGELSVIKRRLRLLRALIETRAILRRGERTQLVQLARDVEGLAQGEDLSWQVAALIIDCYLIEGFQRAGALLIPRLLEARQQAELAGELLASLRTRSWLAQTYERAAQWPQVERECLAGLALLEQSGVRTIWAGYLHICLAEAYYAQNRLDEAAGALQEALRIGQHWQQVELLTSGQLDVAQIALARGAFSAADQALSQAEALAQRDPWAYLPSPVATYRVRYWLAVGELDAAWHWAEQAVFSPDALDPHDQWVVLMLVRVRLVLGQPPQALELLERFHGPLNRPGDPLTAMEWLALYVVALHQAGRQKEAQIATARLLALTEPAGAIRVYVDEGEPMRHALLAFLSLHSQQHEVTLSPAPYVSKLLAAFEQEEPLTAKQTPTAGQPFALAPAMLPPAADQRPFRLEPLSAQELKVLQLLVAGCTYAEMAQCLIVSIHTIKTQVSSIYRKLGVSRRAEAIAASQQFHLL